MRLFWLNAFCALTLIASATPAFAKETVDVDEKSVKALIAYYDSSREVHVLPLAPDYIVEFDIRPSDQESADALLKLSESDRHRFQESRMFVLTRLATILTKVRPTFGLMTMVKEKIRRLIPRKDPRNPIEELSKASLPDELETPPRLKKRNYEVIERILRSVDKQLWSQAALVAKHDELLITAGANVIAEAGVRGRGIGGSLGLGLRAGYNRRTGGVLMQFYAESEKFEKAITPTFLLGVVPKIGIVLQASNGGKFHKDRGVNFYPPVAPGYMSVSSDALIIGFSSAFFSFPSILGDAFSYVNKASTYLFTWSSALTNNDVNVAEALAESGAVPIDQACEWMLTGQGK